MKNLWLVLVKLVFYLLEKWFRRQQAQVLMALNKWNEVSEVYEQILTLLFADKLGSISIHLYYAQCWWKILWKFLFNCFCAKRVFMLCVSSLFKKTYEHYWLNIILCSLLFLLIKCFDDSYLFTNLNQFFFQKQTILYECLTFFVVVVDLCNKNAV